MLRGLGVELLCLGMTKDGSPRHPLYVPADQVLSPWPGQDALDGELPAARNQRGKKGEQGANTRGTSQADRGRNLSKPVMVNREQTRGGTSQGFNRALCCARVHFGTPGLNPCF